MNYIRPRLNPACNDLLVCRNGNQISNLTNIFGCLVYEAIGKYINPTCYRQIIETETIEKLNTSEQANFSQDQKHTSAVAKIHYQKLKSEDVAAKAKKITDKIRDENESSSVISLINSDTESSLVIMLRLILIIAQKLEHFLLPVYALKKYLSQKWKTAF